MQQAITHSPAESPVEVDLGHELTKGFAARCIRRKVRQLLGKARLNKSDRDDLEQELKLALIERFPNFDATKSHWNAFVTTVVERQVATLLASRRTQKREHSQNIVSLGTPTIGEDGELTDLARLVAPEHKQALTACPVANDRERFELTHDLELLFEELPDELRELCVRLQSQSIAQIARETGTARSTLHDRIYKLREIFTAAGMESFFGIDPTADAQFR